MSSISEDPFMTTVSTSSTGGLPQIIEDTEITIQHDDDDDDDHQVPLSDVPSPVGSPPGSAEKRPPEPSSPVDDVNTTTYDEEEEELQYDEETLDREAHASSVPGGTHKSKERFVINFLSAVDIPAATDFRSKCDPFLRAHIAAHQSRVHQNRTLFKMKRVTPFLTTHSRNDCNSAVWNCFRDFQLRPPDDAVLVVECLHSGDPDIVLGRVDIPMASLKDDSVKTFFFIPAKPSNRQKYPKFSVNLQRAWIDETPPKIKTFFLIRHGESKWNKAQSKIDIPGMLDRDHPLTEVGIQQAEALNKKWREYAKLPAFQMHFPQIPISNQDHPVSDGIGGSPKFNSPRQSPSRSTKNYAVANLLDLDDYNEPEATSSSPSPSPSALTTNLLASPKPSPALAQTPMSAASDSCKSTIDFFSDNFVLQQLQGQFEDVDDDDNFRASLSDIDNDSDCDDDDDLAEKVGGLQKKSSNINMATSSGSTMHSRKNGERLSDVDELQDGSARSVERESAMERNAELLANQFHANNNNLAVSESCVAEQRHEGYIRLFLHADRVFTSPLTRALQTALLSMEGHRAVTSHGFILYSIIREVRRLGGLDTMGIEVGEGVERRVRSELAAILGTVRADELLSCPLTTNDADCMWWTPISSHDNEQDQTERIIEFLTFSRYCESKIPVFVGHSLFFRAFYSKRVSHRLLTNRKQLSEKLKRFRLSNASILAVTVVYKDLKDGRSEALMLDADLIFGGGFHGHTATSQSRRDFISQLGTSPTVFGNLSIPTALAANLHSELRNKTEQLSNGVKKFSEKLLSHF